MKNEINLQKNYFVWQCHYKPLSDIINGDIKLSWPIKLSFINDIIQDTVRGGGHEIFTSM
ncbi:hypothetical protein BLA29_006836 [Euroglyphus maynei]|uniref:Uncharacterized protein n=1 Tax=Euroglyphus maynei TaxID=6958 RepID=A0A1Y3BNF3_EURMA|nr:hypothetical protein BLA29_006836 [Euroglyphus maynei]